jgi:hypothetical protein
MHWNRGSQSDPVSSTACGPPEQISDCSHFLDRTSLEFCFIRQQSCSRFFFSTHPRGVIEFGVGLGGYDIQRGRLEASGSLDQLRDEVTVRGVTH